jgi:nucleoside phosphorylase
VIMILPEAGKVAASTAASQCKPSFPNIELCLVVGICGGIPSYTRNDEEHSIVLGDVVISKKMVQYDRGRQYSDHFEYSRTTKEPKTALLTLLNRLSGSHGGERLEAAAERHLLRLARSKKDGGVGASALYPTVPEEDTLFAASYRHRHPEVASCPVCASCNSMMDPVCPAALRSSCAGLGCDKAAIIRRVTTVSSMRSMSGDRIVPTTSDDPVMSSTITTIFRPPGRPRVHFGMYASGDRVIKSGQERDRIVAEYQGDDVLAFEMEGAGAWDQFPGSVLVIKALSDYADCHKGAGFQRYAAACAAACAYAFLEEWSAQEADGHFPST